MSFTWDITIPAGKTEATPLEKNLKITHGVITKMEITFPPGCHSLVKVKLLKGKLFGLLPTNPDEWLTGDGQTVSYVTFLPVDDMPYELDFMGCSPLTIYPHKVTVRVEMMKEELANPFQVMRDFVNIMKRLIGT